MAGNSEKRELILANHFDPDSLEINRSGLLTPQQIRKLRSQRSGRGMVLVIIGVICIVLGVWGVFPSQQSAENGRFGAVTVIIGGVVLIALRFSDFGRSYRAELAAGRLSSVEGFVRVRHTSSSGDSGGQDTYYYKIDGQEFESTEAGTKLINPRSRYRVYYVPDSDIMVNIEPVGTPLRAELSADEVSAIVGEPMREESADGEPGTAAWPGMVINAFGSTTTKLHVVVGFLLGAQDSSVLNFYRRFLINGPDSRSVSGLGDEATFSRGQLLVRRGDVFILVIVMSLDHPRDPEQVLNIEQRLAKLALHSLR